MDGGFGFGLGVMVLIDVVNWCCGSENVYVRDEGLIVMVVTLDCRRMWIV